MLWHHLTDLVSLVSSYCIAAATLNTAARYFSLFLMLGGLFGSYNVALAWISSSFPRPRGKRAAAYAIINSLGSVVSAFLEEMQGADSVCA